MTQQQRKALDEILRHGPLDVGGDVVEQRAIFHEMISGPAARRRLGQAGRARRRARRDRRGPRDRSVGRRALLPRRRVRARLGARLRRPGRRRRPPRRGPGHLGRLPPRARAPFPAAVDDAVAAYRALLAEGVPGERIAFVGESAGGGLVAATLLALKDTDLPQPAAAAVFSPWVDLTVSGASATGKAEVDPALTADALRLRARDYLGDRDPATPLASPIFGDLTGLPPLLIQVGSHEILLDDAVRLAARAGTYDVPVELQVWPEVPHVFQGFAALLDEADSALNSAAEFIKRNWAD
jgi:monoterpene epsilon-lactone hydrolase